MMEWIEKYFKHIKTYESRPGDIQHFTEIYGKPYILILNPDYPPRKINLETGEEKEILIS